MRIENKGSITMSEAQNFAPLERTTALVKNPLKVIKGYKKGGKMVIFNGSGDGVESEIPADATQGIYEGVKESKMEDGSIVTEYMVREADGTLTLLRACSTLSDGETGLAAVEKGTPVLVEFLGMKKAKSGRSFANFRVNTPANNNAE